ncbi:MAG: LEA type 2 family protein [Myxococcota bacterium]
MWWGMWLGCARFVPMAEVTDVGLSKITLSGVGVVAEVEVTNPWWSPFTVDALSWSFTIGEATLTAGELAKAVYVRPNGITTVEVPLELAYADLASATAALTAPQVPYALNLDVHASTDGGPMHWPLSFEGTLPRIEAPTLDLVDWSTQMNGTDLEVDLVVKLGLPSGFALHDGAWRLTVDEHRIGQGRFETQPDGPLHFPLVVDATGSTKAWWAWLQGEAKVLALDLEGAVSTPIGIVPLDLHQGMSIGGSKEVAKP